MNKFKIASFILLISLAAFALSAFIGPDKKAGDQVIIYSNGDKEATDAMDEALKRKGFEGKYKIQSLGTSEIGGKLLAEGQSIEADVVTMASYFIESAQEKNDMFIGLTSEQTALEQHPNYYLPILGNMGAIFVNTEVLKSKSLPTPASIKDLTKPVYKDLVSIPNIMDSSTGWLLTQAVLHEYGEKEGQAVLSKLLTNVGPHLESSGSGPIKKVQAGEVAVGFGLRAQAVHAKRDGLPIDYIDPAEGNFSLTESVAVVDKKGEKQKLAIKMAKVIANEARPALLNIYPMAIYEDEIVTTEQKPKYPMSWEQPLTVDLLKKHQNIFTEAKEAQIK